MARGAGPLPGSRTNERLFWPVAVLCLGLILAFGFRTHELWRDEAQAWLLARDAPSFWSLLTGEARRYERHPFLWFWVLRAVASLSTSALALSAAAYVLALVNGGLILGLPMLLRWQRVLLALSYFPLFEYGILARSYSLALTLLLLAVHAAHARWRHRGLLVGLCAGLAANTVIAASIPAAVVVLSYSSRSVFGRPRAKGASTSTVRADSFAPLAIFGALLLVAKVTTPVARDAIATVAPLPPLDHSVVVAVGKRLVSAFVPIPKLAPDDGVWWNTSLLLPSVEPAAAIGSREAIVSGLVAALGYAIAFGWVWALRSDRVTSGALAVAFALTLDLFMRISADGARYEGHLVLCVLVALAAALGHDPTLLRDRLVRGLFVLTFGSGVLASAVALYESARLPFSQSRAVARHIVNEGGAALPIVGFEYYRMAPIAAYLGREFYSPELERVISYGVWSRRWHSRFYESVTNGVFQRALCWALAESGKGTDVLMLASEPFIVSPELGDRIRFERSFVGSQAHEDYWVYRVRRSPPGSAGSGMSCAR